MVAPAGEAGGVSIVRGASRHRRGLCCLPEAQHAVQSFGAALRARWWPLLAAHCIAALPVYTEMHAAAKFCQAHNAAAVDATRQQAAAQSNPLARRRRAWVHAGRRGGGLQHSIWRCVHQFAVQPRLAHSTLPEACALSHVAAWRLDARQRKSLHNPAHRHGSPSASVLGIKNECVRGRAENATGLRGLRAAHRSVLRPPTPSTTPWAFGRPGASPEPTPPVCVLPSASLFSCRRTSGGDSRGSPSERDLALQPCVAMAASLPMRATVPAAGSGVKQHASWSP